MAVCKQCGAQLSDDMIFCTQCGLRVTADEAPASDAGIPDAHLSCPNCGAPAAAGSNFCTQCGKPLTPASGGECGSRDKSISSDAAKSPQASAEPENPQLILEDIIAKCVNTFRTDSEPRQMEDIPARDTASEAKAETVPASPSTDAAPDSDVKNDPGKSAVSGATKHTDKRAVIAISAVAVLVVVLIALALTAGKSFSLKNDAGYYGFDCIVSGDQKLNAASLGSGSDYYTYYIKLYSNGTAQVYTGSEIADCTWKHGTIRSSATNEDIPYTIEDESLRIDTGDITIVFRRLSEDPDYDQHLSDMSPDTSSTAASAPTSAPIPSSAPAASPAPVPSSAPVASPKQEVISSLFNTDTNSSSFSTWAGTWYGYWTIYMPTGDYSDMQFYCYDCCVEIEHLSENEVGIVMYDELCQSDTCVFDIVATDFSSVVDYAHAFCSDYSLFGVQQESNLLVWDNSESVPNQLVFAGEYEDDKGSFNYFVIVCPWGTLWDDTSMLYYYDSWYLPLIEAGRMPTDVIGVLD